MNYPNWLSPHDPYYDQFSIEIDQFSFADHFEQYVPDFGDEVGCRSIIMPSPRKSARNYVSHNKFILIGIYRDIGREPAMFPLIRDIPWAVSGNEIIFFQAGNKVRVDDYVYCYNTFTPNQQYLKCVSRTPDFFTLKIAALVGISNTSGTSGSYRIDRIKNFAEENIVFRTFPNFKLITYQQYLDIVTKTAPIEDYQSSITLKNITTDRLVRTPIQLTSDTNYSEPNNFEKIYEIGRSLFKLNVLVKGDKFLRYEHSQCFSPTGRPLRLTYDDAGQVIPPNYYDSKYKNEQIYYGTIIKEEVPDIVPAKDDRVWCYDFYGIDINDPFRGPYNLSTIISRNESVSSNLNNISRAVNVSGLPIYPTNQHIYDSFGNIVIGINENNSLNVTRQRIPIQLDNFGKPLKFAIG